MDQLIAAYPAQQDGDLMLCERDGVAYQRVMRANRVTYDDTYLAKVRAYEGTDIAKAVNAGRVSMLMRQLGPCIRGVRVLDVGAGTGEFIRAAIQSGFVAMGCDPMPAARKALIEAALWCSEPAWFDAVTMWDSIEHMESPADMLGSIPAGARLFVSTPIFDDLRAIRDSKHYRPGEHLYYWTADGLVSWLGKHGFVCKEASDHEVRAGRDSIGAFAFRRIR